MKSFQLPIIVGKYSDPWTATAYEPFEGAPFVVHRDALNRGGWRITHRQTTFLSADERPSRKAALQEAERLSKLCPSASKVRGKTDETGRIHVALTGPHRKLRAEIKAAYVGAA